MFARAAALALIATLAPACGGEGGTGGPTGAVAETGTVATEAAATTEGGSAAERADYIARADAMCAEVGASKEGQELSTSLDELRETPQTDPSFDDKAAAHFRKVLRLAHRFRDEFAALPPPRDDEAQVREFLNASDEATEHLEDVIAALESGRDPRPTLEAYGAAIAKASRLAEAYGFQICGRNDQQG